MNCSQATAAEVDDEVKKMLFECYDEAKKILNEHRKELDKLAEFLYKKETITGAQFMKILREVQSGKEVILDNDGNFVETPEVPEQPWKDEEQ